MDKILSFKVHEGWMPPLVERQLRGVLSQIDDAEIVARKRKSKRSNEQNRYAHLLFSTLKDGLNALGNNFTQEQCKELMKAKFLLVDVYNNESGEHLGQRVRGTSELTVEEMYEFTTKIIVWASELGIILPIPDENEFQQ